jgi:ACS family pantothenate transporter-like MFS transporter
MDTCKKTHEVEVNSTPSGSQADLALGETEPQKLSLGKKILYHLWDSDQHLKSAHERALVRKLDFGILICATLGWVSGWLLHTGRLADLCVVDEIH